MSMVEFFQIKNKRGTLIPDSRVVGMKVARSIGMRSRVRTHDGSTKYLHINSGP